MRSSWGTNSGFVVSLWIPPCTPLCSISCAQPQCIPWRLSKQRKPQKSMFWKIISKKNLLRFHIPKAVDIFRWVWNKPNKKLEFLTWRWTQSIARTCQNATGGTVNTTRKSLCSYLTSEQCSVSFLIFWCLKILYYKMLSYLLNSGFASSKA